MPHVRLALRRVRPFTSPDMSAPSDAHLPGLNLVGLLLFLVFLFGAIASPWLANFLVTRRPKR